MKPYRLGLLMGLLTIPQGSRSATLLDKDRWKVSLTGFAEVDFIHDSTRSLRELMGNNPVDRPGTLAGDNGRFFVTPRASRLGFEVETPAPENWKTKATLEFDFFGFDPEPTSAVGNSETSFFTNSAPRMRHAFFLASSKDWEFLVGQTWALFGYQANYVPTTAAFPPVAGVVFARTPQFRATRNISFSEKDLFSASFAVSRPAQADSEIPNADAGVRMTFGERRASYVSPIGPNETQPMSVAISGTVRDITGPVVSGAKAHYLGAAFAVNAAIPLLASSDGKETGNNLVLVGEYSRGQGYADVFPGWTGNLTAMSAATPTLPNLDAGFAGISKAEGTFELVQLQSWNATLQYHLPQGWETWVNVIYGELSSGNVTSLVSTRSLYHRTQFFGANVFHDFTANIRTAVEVSQEQVGFADGIVGKNTRFQVTGWFRL